ncbi:MAG TPA: hemolysin family protein [Nevskiaceae bacterium]|nr:hemolysin family protein [Nevskiaceae bacterium]
MDVTHNLLLIVAAFLLVLLNAFFVAAEFAIVKLRATRVEALRRDHGLLGRALTVVHGHLDAYLSACQLGITLASLGLGWIGEPAFARLLEGPLHLVGIASEQQIHTIAFVTAFAFISFLHIVLGELAPKSLALREPEGLALVTSIPLLAFYWVMYPAIWLLNASANRILRGVGVAQSAEEKPYSEEELRTILHFSRAAQQEEEGEPSEVTQLMTHTLELAELEAGDVMRSRREMVTLSPDLPMDALREAIQAAGYSRYPLVDASNDDIVGIVHVKDVLMEPPGDDLGPRLRALARAPVHVKTGTPALELLRRFRHGTSHFALVYDADGIAGFLTLEDLLETVFGEIVDEHEKSRGKTIRRGPVKLKDGSLMVRGGTPLFLVERALGQPVNDAGDASTVGGLVMAKLGHVPQVNDLAEFEAFAVTVRRMDGPRIAAAKLTPRPATED